MSHFRLNHNHATHGVTFYLTSLTVKSLGMDHDIFEVRVLGNLLPKLFFDQNLCLISFIRFFFS